MLAKFNQKTETNQPYIYTVIETSLILIGVFVLLYFLPYHSGRGPNFVRIDSIAQSFIQGKVLDNISIFYKTVVGPLFAVPFWFLGKLYKTSEWWCGRYNFFLFAGGLFLIYQLLKNHMDRSILRKFLLILIAASMFPHHVSSYGSHEVFTAMMVTVGVLAIMFNYPFSGWCAVILGAANTPASIIGLGCLVLIYVLEKKQWRYFLVVPITVMLICAELWIRVGNPFITGYEADAGFPTILPYSGEPEFSYPLFFGVLSVLLSFGRGLVFFAPGLLLSVKDTLSKIKQELYTSYKLWMCFLIGMIILYSKWWGWHGGFFWGPRFFLFASIPASFALAVRLQDHNKSLLANLFTMAVLCLSVWVGISGAVFGQYGLDICLENNFALEHLCWYVPEFSVLWRPFVVTRPICWHKMVIMGYCFMVFIYLAAPLFKILYKQITMQLANFRATYLDFKNWHY